MIKFYLIFLLSFFCAAHVFAEEELAPTEADLKASYCLAIKKAQKNDIFKPDQMHTEELESKIREINNKVNDDINRLESYLLPRLPYLDIFALSLAQQRGLKDYADKPNVDNCLRSSLKCEETQQKDCLHKCLIKGHPAYERTTICHELDFLPY